MVILCVQDNSAKHPAAPSQPLAQPPHPAHRGGGGSHHGAPRQVLQDRHLLPSDVPVDIRHSIDQLLHRVHLLRRGRQGEVHRRQIQLIVRILMGAHEWIRGRNALPSVKQTLAIRAHEFLKETVQQNTV